ncbi:MAG: class I SAM-dependent methyltransferase [Candidatus Doudnabacteria bacterium]|nr:class I SAM-dependent methyltransferase [Candidatus Doudnabacteria bacterium]
MENVEKIKYYYERKKIAEQINNARKQETAPESLVGNKYITSRSGREVVYRMGGLMHVFEYVKTLSSNRILDIGTGSGNAAKKISQMPMAQGLDFSVTALSRDPELFRNFPPDKARLTGTETLRGIKNNSVGGILAMYSVAYSAYPNLAIKRLDEVLVPGGIFKGVFANLGKSVNYSGSVAKDYEQFENVFKKLGYDVASLPVYNTASVEAGGLDIQLHRNSVLLAIKPGNSNAPEAIKLLDEDLEEIEKDSLNGDRHLNVYDFNDLE